jgi:hypothetical protein
VRVKETSYGEDVWIEVTKVWRWCVTQVTREIYSHQTRNLYHNLLPQKIIASHITSGSMAQDHSQQLSKKSNRSRYEDGYVTVEGIRV